MTAILASIAASIVNALLARFFPGHPQLTPEAIAQQQKDRADNSEALLKAKVQGDAIENKFNSAIAGDPIKLREPDKFQLK